MERKPEKLKRYFLMLIAWAVAVVLIIGGSFLYKWYQGSQYEAAAVPYIEQTLPLLAQWDPDTTTALLAPETLEDIPEGNITKAMELFSKLGRFETMEEPEFEEAMETPGPGDVPSTLLTYTVDTRFTHGDAQFKIQLIDRGDHFQLYNFTLSSETLTGPAQ